MRKRLAFVVSHPIQYFVPLYRRLAQRNDIDIKVYFTWHAGGTAVYDPGFGMPVAWDIPLTDGYEFELVPNQAADPGTHHFRGLQNRRLGHRVLAWRPDVIHLSGWAGQSHLLALRHFATNRIPVLFWGDSHLLDEALRGPHWQVKRAVLSRVFRWPGGFLCVGAANRAYYQAFGVTAERLFACPHSIDVARFAEPGAVLEQQASEWRQRLGIGPQRCVLLYAGKFEPKKHPLELMRAVRDLDDDNVVLLMVGSGELEAEIRAFAAVAQSRFIVEPFQNQTRMPVVYRLGDLCILPSGHGETWGLAVNEAMACGRPVVVSDRVGCAQDLVDDATGRVFSWRQPQSLSGILRDLVRDRGRLAAMGRAASNRARSFDIPRTEEALMHAVQEACRR